MKRALGFMNKITVLGGKTIAAYLLQSDGTDSKNGYNGTSSGSVTFSSGKNGNGAVFNNGIITVSQSMINGTQVSVNLWVKLDSHTPISIGNTGLIATNTEVAATHYPYSNGTIYLAIFTNSRKTIGAGIVADRTQWHMVTITANSVSDVWKFYQNGTLVTTSTVGAFPSSTETLLGNSTAGYSLIGMLDEVTFFNEELSLSEISELYNSGNGKFYPF